jgi:hypothetical protein
MANSSRVAMFFATLVLLQVSCAVSRYVDVPAVMTVNGFQQGEGGGGPAACDGQYHSDDEFIVSLSSQWFAGGERCGKLIRITDSRNLRMSAVVVDECRSCDNEVGASPAIWRNYHLDPSLGEVNITWSDFS